jgi:hypothetical protein
MRIVFFLSLLLALFACDKTPAPITLAQDSALFGTWEYQFDEFQNGVTTDQFLLVIHMDSTIDYKRCKNRVNGHSYAILPASTILKFEQNKLLIGPQWFFSIFDEELVIEKFPFAEKNDTFMVVNQAKLRKLKPGEISNHESWKCSDDDDKEA